MWKVIEIVTVCTFWITFIVLLVATNVGWAIVGVAWMILQYIGMIIGAVLFAPFALVAHLFRRVFNKSVR